MSTLISLFLEDEPLAFRLYIFYKDKDLGEKDKYFLTIYLIYYK
jgi:hypothetical protein